MEEMKDRNRKPLFMTNPFCLWIKDKKEVLMPEEHLARTLFYSGMVHTADYSELYTYEKNYVNQMARKAF